MKPMFENTSDWCRNLAFLHTLTTHVGRLAPLLDRFLASGYTNLSFVFTSALPGKDKTYPAVRALWDDLVRSLGRATVDSRKEYYRQAFRRRLDDDFAAVERVLREAAIGGSVDLDTHALDQLVASASAQASASNGAPVASSQASAGRERISIAATRPRSARAISCSSRATSGSRIAASLAA